MGHKSTRSYVNRSNVGVESSGRERNCSGRSTDSSQQSRENGSYWLSSYDHKTVQLKVESFDCEKRCETFDITLENYPVKTQQPKNIKHDRYDSAIPRTFSVDLKDFLKESAQAGDNLTCFSRRFPDNPLCLGTVKEILQRDHPTLLQVYPHPSMEAFLGVIYLVPQKKVSNPPAKKQNSQERGRSKSFPSERNIVTVRFSRSRSKSGKRLKSASPFFSDETELSRENGETVRVEIIRNEYERTRAESLQSSLSNDDYSVQLSLTSNNEQCTSILSSRGRSSSVPSIRSREVSFSRSRKISVGTDISSNCQSSVFECGSETDDEYENAGFDQRNQSHKKGRLASQDSIRSDFHRCEPERVTKSALSLRSRCETDGSRIKHFQEHGNSDQSMEAVLWIRSRSNSRARKCAGPKERTKSKKHFGKTWNEAKSDDSKWDESDSSSSASTYAPKEDTPRFFKVPPNPPGRNFNNTRAVLKSLRSIGIALHDLQNYFVFTNPLDSKIPAGPISSDSDEYVEKRVSFRRPSLEYHNLNHKREARRSESSESSSEAPYSTSLEKSYRRYESSRGSESESDISEKSQNKHESRGMSRHKQKSSGEITRSASLNVITASDHGDARKENFKEFRKMQLYHDRNPGSGEIVTPLDLVPKKNELPPEELVLEYIHGYRSRDVSNNAYYLNEDHIVFPSGCIGVVMNIKTKKQRFFQGRHRQEISSLALHPSQKLVVTGDVVSGSDGCYLYVWDPFEPEDVQRMVQIRVGDRKLGRGIIEAQFTGCGKYIAAVSMEDEHKVYVYNWKKAGKLVAHSLAGKPLIFGLSTNPYAASEFVTFGAKRLTFWKLHGYEGKLENSDGIFNCEDVATIVCATFLRSSMLATGTHKGQILMWGKRQVLKILDSVLKGPVFSIREEVKSGLLSGGKDGSLVRLDLKRLEVVASISMPSCIKSLDVSKTGKILVGMEGSELMEISKFEGKSNVLNQKIGHSIVQGHKVSNQLELWGIATNPVSENEYVTVGDDSFVFLRDLNNKKTVAKVHLQGKLRSVGYSPEGKYIAVGSQNGDIYILKANDLAQVHFQKFCKPDDIDKKNHGINVVKFSPNGKFLAAGTDESVVYVWQITDGFKRIGLLKGHSQAVYHLDWSKHSNHIRSDSRRELINWSIPGGTKVLDLRGVEWASKTCPSLHNSNGSVLTMAVDTRKKIFVNGEDSGFITLQGPSQNPMHPYKRYFAHLGGVSNVLLDSSKKYLISTGAYDGNTFEWRVEKPIVQ